MITVQKSEGSRYFTWVSRTLMIRQGPAGKPKSMNSKTVLQVIDTSLASSIWRVSGEFCISQSSVVYHLYNLDKSIQSCWIEPHVIQILQNFWLTLVCNWAIGLMSIVFTNGLGDWGSIQGWVIPKTQKMVLDATLLNTQHFKVRIKGKAEQSMEWSSALPYISV